MASDKIVCFINSFTINKNSTRLNQLLEYLTKSACVDILDNIYINNFGDEIQNIILKNKNGEDLTNKIIITNNPNLNLYQIPTLNLIRDFSENNQAKILYLHTKGLYELDNPNIIDWINYMLFFLTENTKKNLELVNKYDILGTNIRTENSGKYFSGNFWWANSSYIKKLDKLVSNSNINIYDPNSDKYIGNKWILSKTNNYLNLHNSNINHYIEAYPRYKYENYKLLEPIQVNSESNIKVQYGIPNKLIDITNLFIKNFVNKNIIFIPKGILFNTYFGDPAPGTHKKLILKIYNIIFQFEENIYEDIKYILK